MWTVDWEQVQKFITQFAPQSDMVYVNIVWGGKGGLHIIRKETQQLLHAKNGMHWYCKLPRQGTNFRGVEISKEAMRSFVEHESTLCIPIAWNRDKSLLEERVLYRRWEELWDTL